MIDHLPGIQDILPIICQHLDYDDIQTIYDTCLVFRKTIKQNRKSIVLTQKTRICNCLHCMLPSTQKRRHMIYETDFTLRRYAPTHEEMQEDVFGCVNNEVHVILKEVAILKGLYIHNQRHGPWVGSGNLCTVRVNFNYGSIDSKDDIPAIVWSDGLCEWYKDGVLHRGNDKPAVVYPNGTDVSYYVNGVLHRNFDKPAWCRQGRRVWYSNGQRHRERDLPADIARNGSMMWYKHNLLHRDGDKPAVIYLDSKGESWLNVYYKYGQIHRDGHQPAEVGRDPCYTVWYQCKKGCIATKYRNGDIQVERLCFQQPKYDLCDSHVIQHHERLETPPLWKYCLAYLNSYLKGWV